MYNKETGAIDKLIDGDDNKGKVDVSVLDLWDDYVEKNKKLCQIKEEESWINSISEDVHLKWYCV